MPKYNFEVRATITCFIQRDCEDAAEAEHYLVELEKDRWDLSELIRGADVDLEDTEILNYGEQE